MTYDLELFLFLLLFLILNLFVFILLLRSMMNCLVSASSHKSNGKDKCRITGFKKVCVLTVKFYEQMRVLEDTEVHVKFTY